MVKHFYIYTKYVFPFVLYYGGIYGYKASTQSIVGTSPITDTVDWVAFWSKSRTYSYGDIIIARNGIFVYIDPNNINSIRGVEPVNGEDGWDCIFCFVDDPASETPVL